jgi:uncharacterized protein (DUF488 family)
MSGRNSLFTIGHSNHPIERFVELLRSASVAAIADVRTVPFSRWVPRFSRTALERHLETAGIAYLFFGEALGGRPSDTACWRDGRVDFDLVAATDSFRRGLDRVQLETSHRPVALMCAERDPLDCHRFLLVSRRLAERGAQIRHILADGAVEDQSATEQRMLDAVDAAPTDLFAAVDPLEARIVKAYQARNHATTRRPVRSGQ